MKQFFIWTLGISILVALTFFSWKYLIKTPNILLGETNVVTGKVVDVFPSSEVKSYSRKIKYVYQVDGIYYTDFKRLGTSDHKQAIGNELKVTYSINKPKRNKANNLSNKNRSSNAVKFYSNMDGGYLEMNLINGIFKYKEYADGGLILNDFVGEYLTYRDSVTFTYYQLKPYESSERPVKWVLDGSRENNLIDPVKKRIYKRVN